MIWHETEAIAREREIATAPGVVLRHRRRHLPAPGDARARRETPVTGPLGRLVTLLVRPLSAYGRRRHPALLTRLAEFSDRRESA